MAKRRRKVRLAFFEIPHFYSDFHVFMMIDVGKNQKETRRNLSIQIPYWIIRRKVWCLRENLKLLEISEL